MWKWIVSAPASKPESMSSFLMCAISETRVL
jgi:hypothetical protein